MLTSDTELGGENVTSALSPGTLVKKKDLFVSRIIPVTCTVHRSLCSACCLLWCAKGRLPRARVGRCGRKPMWLLTVGKLEGCNYKHEDGVLSCRIPWKYETVLAGGFSSSAAAAGPCWWCQGTVRNRAEVGEGDLTHLELTVGKSLYFSYGKGKPGLLIGTMELTDVMFCFLKNSSVLLNISQVVH